MLSRSLSVLSLSLTLQSFCGHQSFATGTDDQESCESSLLQTHQPNVIQANKQQQPEQAQPQEKRTSLPLAQLNASIKVLPEDYDTVAELSGVHSNQAGDLNILLSGLGSNVVISLILLGAFSILRLRYPLMYSNNVLTGCAPYDPPLSLFGWITGSLAVPTSRSADFIGLDSALLIEFTGLCMRILVTIGIPHLLVLGPLHFLFGGDVALKNGDHLGRFGMNNVRDGHPWLYYVHALAVCFVSFTIKQMVYQAQANFLQLRFQWLKRLPSPQSTTVLVQGIPEAFRSDQKVREFFSKATSPSAVKEVFMVKQTELLESLVSARDAAQASKYQAEMEFKWTGKRPTMLAGLVRGHVDSIDYHTKEVERTENLMIEERRRIKAEAQTVCGINTSNAFVTFTNRRDAEIAKELDFASDEDQWLVHCAPQPDTIRWASLRKSQEMEFVQKVIGFACAVGLYISFTPVCFGITNVAVQINLGPLQPLWASFAPTLGLLLILSFLPTIFLFIFRTFFAPVARGAAQHKLQVWYFWFQVFFVILVTAVGSDLLKFIKTVSLQPAVLFSTLAEELPNSTHFYLNYMILQWSAHCKGLLRYVPLSKYLSFRTLYTEEEARAMAEPEDQDYYGMGSRSARFSIDMCIAIIFSTLSPSITVFGFLNFALARVVYGYLIVFAETKKYDLGGDFWVTKLRHILKGTIIYCVLMTGVLMRRAPTLIPGLTSCACLLYVVWAVWDFDGEFRWEKLPFVEIMYQEDEVSEVGVNSDWTYEQPELQEKLNSPSSTKEVTSS